MPWTSARFVRIALLVVACLGSVSLWAGEDGSNPFGGGAIVIGQPVADVDPSLGAINRPREAGVSGQAPAVVRAQVSSGRYVVVRGDSLWKIAQRFLGNGARYWELVEANKNRYPSILKNPNLIYPGWEFVIPGVAVPPQSSASTSPGNKTSSTPPKIPAPASGAKGGKALLAWIQATGLTGEALRCAWAVGMKESGGNPRAFNGNSKTGDKSYGLFQINMIGSMGPARLRQYGLKSNEDLFDPVVNCRVMLKMSKNGTNWGPWGIGPNSYKKTQSSAAYERFYNSFPPK